MLVLGVHDGHNSSCALLRDGALVAAVEEERLRRVKNWDARRHPLDGPRLSLSAVLELAGVGLRDVDLVAIPFSSPREDQDRHLRLGHTSGAALGPLIASKAWRMRGIRRLLDRAGVAAKRFQVHHHVAHAASAFLTSGFDRALAVTLDGKGDLLAGGVFLVDRTGIRILREIDQLDSLAILYSAVTRHLGYRTDEDEGKVTALAAEGRPDARIDDALSRLYRCRDGELVGLALRRHANPLRYVKQATGALVGDLRREIASLGSVRPADLALGAQRLLEEATTTLVRAAMAETGLADVCLAGGVFANVRLNKTLAELPAVGRTHVHPAMGDSGLSCGAAAAAHHRWTGELPSTPIGCFALGPGIDPAGAATALRDAGLTPTRPGRLAVAIAELLAAGRCVAVCRGRMEFGPRALGHRSILVAPDDASVRQWLNTRLGRDPVMPFGPVILAEEVDRCLIPREASARDDPFMTTSYDCTPWMKEHCPGVVHIDGTARPQVVRVEESPFLHEILERFRALTGLPCLVNTSLNTHREPIACTARDAIGVYERAGLDHLLVGDLLVGRR